MNLKKSWVNFSLLKNIIKQNLLLVKISLIAVVAFSIMESFGSDASISAFVLFGMSAVILTTCLAGNVQKYMTSRTEASFVASLPIDSFVLWFTHYLAGLLIVVIPLWLESILIALLQKNLFSFTGSPIVFLISFQLATIFLAVIYYTISFFVSCIAGSRLGQFLYTVVFYALPTLLYIVIVFGGEALTFGNFASYSTDLLYLCLPLASGLEFISNGTWNYVLWDILIIIVFFIAGYYVFKKRSIENTGEAILYKSVNVVFRTIVVVITSLFTFIILSKAIAIIPDCRISTIFLGGCIFVVLGSLIALLVEIIFKSNHIYKSMIYYIPIFILSYLGCYAYGNFMYQDLKQEILANEEVTLRAYSNFAYGNQFFEGDYAAFKSKDIKKVFQDLEKNPEKIYKSNGIVDDRDYITLEIRISNTSRNEMNYFTLKVDRDYFNEVSEKNADLFVSTVDPQMISEIEKNGSEYWYLCYGVDEYFDYRDIDATKNVFAVLTKQDVSKILTLLQSEEYAKNTTIFTSKISLVVEGSVYSFRLNSDFVSQLISEDNVNKQTRQMNHCIDALNTQMEDIITLKPELAKGKVVSYSIFNPITDYHIIDDTTVKVRAQYEIYDESIEKTTMISYLVTFEVQGDNVKAIKVEGGHQ